MINSIVFDNHKELNKQYVFYKVIHTLANLIVWSYFAMLLLRTAESPIDAVPLVVIYQAMEYFGLMTGFIVSASILPRWGYMYSYKTYVFFQLFTVTLALLSVGQIQYTYPIIGLMLGVGRGIYWNNLHVFNTVEIGHRDRAKLISVMFTVEQILGVVLPVLVGAVLTYSGYEIVFFIGLILYFLALIYPWQHSTRAKDKLHISEFKKIIRQPAFKTWAGFMILNGYTGATRTIVIWVIPFLFIGSEFGVGILTTVVGLLGAILSYSRRNDNISSRFKEGLIGSGIIVIINIGLILVWNLPALIIRSLIMKIGSSLFDPAVGELTYHVRSAVINDFKNSLSLEVNIMSELLMVIGRTFGVLTILIGIFVFKLDINLMLIVAFGISIIREPMIMFFNKRIADSVRDSKHQGHLHLLPGYSRQPLH